MPQPTTLLLLPQTPVTNAGITQPYIVTGNAQPAAGYYLSNKNLQTVSISTLAFTGNILIEASLYTQPSDSEWFQVYKLESNTVSNTVSNLYTNIEGNFVWIRAKIDGFFSGIVQHVKVSY